MLVDFSGFGTDMTGRSTVPRLLPRCVRWFRDILIQGLLRARILVSWISVSADGAWGCISKIVPHSDIRELKLMAVRFRIHGVR